MYRHLSYKYILAVVVASLFLISVLSFSSAKEIVRKMGSNKLEVVSFIADPTKHKIQFFWKDKHGKNYSNFENLKTKINKTGKTLIFATNGGMYEKGHKPKGLYIENGKVLSPTDKFKKGYGNFYLKPNGIFYLKETGKTYIATTKKLKSLSNIKYASQSGPMLVIDGKIHPKFNKSSKHVNIRNGVCILPNGKILFAMSKQKVTFYDFASYFKENNCSNALYLDGFISKTYLPSEGWEQTDGKFGVIIGVIAK